MQAIVYTSNAGHTKAYAELLAQQTGLPVYDLKRTGDLPRGAEILYLGWLMAGKVKGYRKAARKFSVQAVCAVGMAAGDGQLADIRKVNALPRELPAFCLQGGFEMEKLRGVYRLMMLMMKLGAGRGLSEKPDRTAEEDEMLELMLCGGSRVRAENLAGVLDWMRRQA